MLNRKTSMLKTIIINIILFLFIVFNLPAQPQKKNILYLDANLPFEKRVENLISLMTIDEKISQMGNESPAIPRLKIKAYNWWNEALHGVMTGEARVTVFPQAIGLASTWDPDLIFKIASTISDEARACNNLTGKGLTYWSPVINIARDPRWGRTQECYGEDPYLTSRIGIAFIKGMQGDDPKYFKTIATPKHYALNNTEYNRMYTSANIDDRILYEYYLPHFKACIQEGKAYSIMCAYNALNNIPCCANKRLLTDILRNEWGFDGFVVSDCGAIGNILWTHHYVKTLPEAAATALLAGTDLNCGDTYQKYLKEALEKNLITEKDIDKALKRLFMARFKLGEFDPEKKVPYSQIRFSDQGETIKSSFLFTSEKNKNGLTAEYYNGTDFEEKVITKIDSNIAYNWADGSPSKKINNDNFSVRWSGFIKPDKTGTYTFLTYTDDGVRLWIDNKLLIDDWTIHPPKLNEGTIELNAGKIYSLKMEYYESGGGAVCHLKWKTPGKNNNINNTVDYNKNRELSRLAAEKSIVLLKNDKNLLPIDKKKIKKIALIGPMADICQIGNYSGTPYKPVSLLDGLKNKISQENNIEIKFSKGCELLSEITKRVRFSRTFDELFEIRNPSTNDNTFKAEFFNNKEFQGSPVLIRSDKRIYFDWADNPPDSKVNNNDYSTRWTAKIIPKKTGTYWFKTTTDDGVRLFIDNKILIDAWAVRPPMSDIISINLQASKSYDLKLEYFEAGGGAVAKLESGFYEISPEIAHNAIETAKECDMVIFAAGIDLSYAEEGKDLKDLNLPEEQMEILKRIYDVNKNIVVVLYNGNPLTINWIKENIPAIIEAWYPGDEGGNAVADVLFGDFNPSGRLPVTFYKSVNELPDFDDYDIRKGRTYMYMKNEPLFPFGHGLSYTKFEYSDLIISPAKIKPDDTLKIKFNVKNTGPLAGEEVVQVYIKKSVKDEIMPSKELKRFKRIYFLPGETKEISFDLPVSEIVYYNINSKNFVVVPGTIQILVGASSSDIRLSDNFEIVNQNY
ncbi:MAG: glycoside hydrolase family 3 C-terminal domain-containing protein [Candidatus Goldbacteria bacterium]|nr:glycoside hydrolase family 3 C-terminal domain-containing protein [Candidatus Goldiibacteriota bacterium]